MTGRDLTYLWPASMPAPSRAEIEALIEGLIEYLDAKDGDAEHEDGFDAEMTAAEWARKGAHRFNVGVAA